jgi:hypothetical protein
VFIKKLGKVLPVIYDGKEVGVYKPDFVVENKIIIETKTRLVFLKNNLW